MLVCGLTGGIAAGKSLVARRLEQQGIPVIDADRSARAVVEPGTPGLAAVIEAFGDDLRDEHGRLDRAALGQRVFGDDRARERLERILHPLIAMDVMGRLAELAQEGTGVAVVDAALMVETGSYRNYPVLIVVHADDELRLRRIMERDGLDEAQALARIRAQAPQHEKMNLADYLIDNNGSIEETERAVDTLAETLKERAAAG